MFQGDELEDPRSVAVGLEQKSAQAIGHHVGLLPEMHAVLEHRAEDLRALDLASDLLMTARSAHDDLRLRADAQMDGEIGRRIAGMQGDQGVNRLRSVAADRPLTELQPVHAQPRGYVCAEVHQVLSQFDPRYVRLDPKDVPQEVMRGEREVALS